LDNLDSTLKHNPPVGSRHLSLSWFYSYFALSQFCNSIQLPRNQCRFQAVILKSQIRDTNVSMIMLQSNPARWNTRDELWFKTRLVCANEAHSDCCKSYNIPTRDRVCVSFPGVWQWTTVAANANALGNEIDIPQRVEISNYSMPVKSREHFDCIIEVDARFSSTAFLDPRAIYYYTRK